MNMKAIHYLIGVSAMVSCLSCVKEEAPLLQRNTDAMSFGYASASQTYVIKSTRPWTVETEASWITANPSSGSGSTEQIPLAITVAQNDDVQREGVLYVVSGDRRVALTVRQEDGLFYFDAPQIANSFERGAPLTGEQISIPYHKAKKGYLVNVMPRLEGDGAEGITVESKEGFELNPGEGVLTLRLSGMPVSKGAFTVNLRIEIPSAGLTRDVDVTSRVRLPGEVSAALFKLLPRLAVFDWGEYARGTGANGQGDQPRSFLVQILDKSGNVVRHQEIATANWFVNATIFFRKNRFAFGGLDPDTDYVFRIIAHELGVAKEDSDPTEIAFHTPAEVIPANALVYKDFDDWWLGGCSIYQAFSVQGSQAANSWFRSNPDLSSAAVKSATGNRVVNPCFGIQKLLNYATSTGGWVTPDTCPKVWDFYWEGSKWGENYGDEDYPGWQALVHGSRGDIRHQTGCVMLGVNGSNPGWLRTPKLAALGSTPSTVTLTVNTAPYIEPFSFESDLTHFIRVVGPGRIVDGGSTMTERKSDTEIVVQCQSNTDPTTHDYNRDYTVPTTHVVKVEGATGDTRLEICGGNGTKPTLLIDDILIVKN